MKFLLVLAFGLALFLPTASFATSIRVDNAEIESEISPEVIHGRTLVPAREVLQALGCSVYFYPLSHTFIAERAGTHIFVDLDRGTAFVNGTEESLDLPPVVQNGHLLLPLSFIVEATGAEALWNPDTRSVEILSRTGGEINVTGTTPRIDRMTDSASGTLHSGDALTVDLFGTPGGNAWFDIAGVTAGVPMTEIAPGHYQGTYVIEPGMQARNAYVVGHLRVLGQESMAPAKAITIEESTKGLPEIQVRPEPGTVVRNQRPHVQAFFSMGVVSGSVQFKIDGVDRSNEIQTRAGSIFWISPSDLIPGEHRVEMSGKTAAGGEFRREWNFYVTKTQ